MLDPVSWISRDGKPVRAFAPELRGIPGKLRLIDQTRLPMELVYIETDDLEEIYSCIKRLVVRGAPAIGCAAALGLAAVINKQEFSSYEEFNAALTQTAGRLAESRPTAVNLFWALNRCVSRIAAAEGTAAGNIRKLQDCLLEEALNILTEDIAMCRSIGGHGMVLLKEGMGVLTHCNAGALATGDYGTALAPIYSAMENGVKVKVFSDETRPLLQGSRLTAWELAKAGVDVTTICDNMAAQVMKEGRVNLIIVGADRIAANGDTANKIGTYGVAVLAKFHNIPFYVAAPYSTIDITLPDGSGIPIEQRDPEEIRNGFGRQTAPPEVKIYNPAFDVTPGSLISGIITEKGILTPPFTDKIANLVKPGKSS
jgi:methylthioribose-1-phosphate isomerase